MNEEEARGYPSFISMKYEGGDPEDRLGHDNQRQEGT